MKKALVITLAMCLGASALLAPAASAKKKKKKAKPVETTLYLHGQTPIGDGAETATYLTNGTYMTMDTTEPAAGPPKSMSYSLPVGNPDCTGNSLFPSWEGKVAGRIVGDLTWHVHTVAAPSTVTARVWVDVPFSSCTSDAAMVDAFVEPVAEAQVTVPPGSNEVEIVFEGLKLPVVNNIIVELHTNSPTSQGRVLYDSADFASHLEFSCIPASGKSCAQ
ncbi:MAG: hypothetical protein ABR575_09200 [Actinomycetota bacterium]